jgi:5'-3' exonuclease
MIVRLVDGTYELYRQFFGARSTHINAASIGVVRSTLDLLDEDCQHVGVATDHVIESFRNAIYPGYKTGDGMEPEILRQIEVIEFALDALGVCVWPSIELEADDALASAAVSAESDPGVKCVEIYSPDKDLAAMVRSPRVVQIDRRNNLRIGDDEVRAKFGVDPASIPDWLAMVGDTADGFPGIPGWGAKSAAVVLAEYKHVENIPRDSAEWTIKVRGAERLAQSLRDNQELLDVCKLLATLRIDPTVCPSTKTLLWRGPNADFADWCRQNDVPTLAERADKLYSMVSL